MLLMLVLRRRRPPSYLQPESRVARTIQAPQQVKNHQGQWIISSAAFSAAKEDSACSVDVEQLLHEDGLSTTVLFPALPRSVGLFGLFLKDLRAENLDAHHEPIAENWYHGGIRGDALKNHKVRKRLAQACHAIVPIDQVAASALDGRPQTVL